MRALTIGAVSLESARGFIQALSDAGYLAEIVIGGEDAYQVRVRLDGTDRDIHRVLHVLEDHVTARASGPARLELGGNFYTLQPVSDPGGLG